MILIQPKLIKMNQAKYKETGEPLDAEDLKIISDPKSIEFICAGDNCGVPVFPCSYRPENKPRPYFKVGGIEHTSECTYSSFLDYLKIGYKGKLSTSDLVKMEFPSKLKLYTKPKTDDKTQNRVENSEEQDSSRSKRIFSDEFGDEKKSNKVVTTINKIVDFYLSCPYNRDVELDLLGTKKEYYKLFINVTTAKNVNSKELRIYYARFDFRKGGKSLIKLDANNYMIKLFEGIKKDDISDDYEPFHVLIKKDQISKAKFDRIKYEKSQVIQEYLIKYNPKKSTLEGAYIFFVAYPPTNGTPTIFDALHGMVVSRYTKILATILD